MRAAGWALFMPDLAGLQHAFAAALTARSLAGASMAAFAGAPERVRARLALYRGNVQANARKALANAYPVCARLVGDDFFDGLAFEFAARTPSTSGDLNEYGVAFAEFLAGFAPVTEQVPYLPDVARLEWHAHRAHYAEDCAAFAVARLAAVPEDRFGRLCLKLHPACTLLESRWPLAQLWQVHQPDYAGAMTVIFDAAPERVLVYRPVFRVCVTALDAAEYAFLAAAQAGLRLVEAFARATAADPDFVLDSRLTRWVADRIVIDLAVMPE